MGKALIRVESKNSNLNASPEERARDFKNLFTAFHRAYGAAGIKKECKSRQTYEKPGERRRRKKREAEISRIKGNNLPVDRKENL